MTRRAFTLVELFLAIFLGSVLLAIALPLFRPPAARAPQSVAIGLSRIQAAKAELARLESMPADRPIPLALLEKRGLLTDLPPAPEGCVYVPGAPEDSATLVLAP